MTNDELYKKAEESIVNLFLDMSVSQSECKDNLNSLIDFIESMLDNNFE
jgi:hypothetical protein